MSNEWISLKDSLPTQARVDIKLREGSILVDVCWDEESKDFNWYWCSDRWWESGDYSNSVTHWRIPQETTNDQK